uniref:Uncharacterized protein n=1 Tax=Tetradesmus obliquus TaxID=3088 RepID=A0A383VY68_TETOB
MEVLKPLLGSSFRSQPAINALLQHFLGYAGKPLDLLYSRIGGLNGRFFPDGWGNLGIVNLKEDIDLIKQGAWASEGIKVEWKLLQQGCWEGVPYKLYEGSYRTPCVNRIYDALPAESRRGRVQLLMPAAGLGATQLQRGIQPLFSGRHTPAAVLHLAATGDHGFSRRLRLAAPLLQQGVCQLVHESPYYGARRPPQQRGSKLCAVSDLLALGWATIYESLCLLGWLEAEGVTQRGICGLSMGGVHASMTAGLYPRPLAITPLLTPRSAAVAYCDGALAPLMAWRALLQERDVADNEVGGGGGMCAGVSVCCDWLASGTWRTMRWGAGVTRPAGSVALGFAGGLTQERDVADNEVEHVVAAAARPVSLLHRARYVRLQQLEQQLEMVEGSRELWQQQQQQQFSAEHQREEAKSVEAVAAVQQAAALAAVTEAAAAEQFMADNQQQQQQQQQQQMSWSGSAGCAAAGLQEAMAALAGTAATAAAAPSADLSSHQHGQLDRASHHSSSSSSPTSSRPIDDNCRLNTASQQQQQNHASQDLDSWRRQTWRKQPASSATGLEAAAAAAATAAAADPSGLLAALGADAPPADTFRRLRHVLETYTDVTRYPTPVRPDAAVLVAARHDGYVDMASVQALQAHWPGSELRLVDGGHVSAFLLHQEAFRAALRDSLARLEAGAPPAGA